MRRLVGLTYLIILLGGLATMLAQTTTGTFAGTVLDATGGRVAQAAVTALNVETGQKFKAVTTDTGDFIIVQLPTGQYEVDVVAKGFKTLSRKGLTLDVAGKVTLDLTLEIGSISESVSVTAEAPMLRTQDAQVGDIINSLMVENLPQLDRNALDLMKLSGNVAGNGVPGGFQSDIRLNGGRQQGLDVLVDGNSVILGKGHNVGSGGTPTMEQVDEFKVITNGIPAEYGRVSGGLLTLVTKGGTNEFHGQLFEYFQNQMLNANSWEFNNESTYTPGHKAPVAAFHNNEYGFRVGGPVEVPKVYNGKNKTFFFVNWEQTKNRQAGNPKLSMAATTADKNGNMSDIIANGAGPMMYDPLGDATYDPTANAGNGAWVHTVLMPNNGTTVPAARIGPVAQKVDALMPAPNHTPQPGWTQQYAYIGYQADTTNAYQWETRLDHMITDNQRITVRFNRNNSSSGSSEWYDALDPLTGSTVNHALNGSVAYTLTATPTTVFDIRASVIHSPGSSGQAWGAVGKDDGKWGIDPVMEGLINSTPGAIDYRVWTSNMNGWGDNPGVQSQSSTSLDANTSYDLTASVTKIWNRHTIKSGFDTRRMYDNHLQLVYGPISYQSLATEVSDDNNWDSTLNHSPDGRGFADSWGDWLMGMGGVDVSQTAPINLMNRQGYYAAYVQDDFKVSKKLTLNLGLRWDMETPITDRYNHVYGWIQDAPSAWSVPSGYSWTGALQAAGLTAAQIATIPTPTWVTNGKLPNGAPCYIKSPTCPGNTPFEYHPWQFAPRLAAAYSLNNKTVLRASWGMMYLTATGDYWNSYITDADRASEPYPPLRSQGVGGTYGNLVENNAHLFQPSEIVPFSNTNAALDYTVGGFYESGGTVTDNHPAREQNWNFSVQRQLPGQMLLEVGYNGNHSGDLPINGYPVSPFTEKNLLGPSFQKLYQTQVVNPFSSQEQPLNAYSGATVPLGTLLLDNPIFGGVNIQGVNAGRSNYNAATIKLDKRFAQGLIFLFNYTFSKSLDDVGNINGGPGAIAAAPLQSFQTFASAYGYSPADMTHRFSFYHDYQFPVGRGRRFLGAPKGIAGKVIDYAIGGWEYAGIWSFHSGTPLTFSCLQSNISASAGVATLFPVVSGAIANSAFGGDPNKLLVSTLDNIGTGYNNTTGVFNPGSFTVRRFNGANFTDPEPLTPGNIPNVYPWIRNPSSWGYDASLMKNFGIAREGKIYLQLRAEASNVFNMRGLGTYNTTWDSAGFGLIQNSAQNPRHMKISARLFF